MSIASEITRIKSNISQAYDAAAAGGATMPSEKTVANLPATLQTYKVSSGGKWGLTIDNIIGKLDSNGTLSMSDITLTFDDATKIEGLATFQNNPNIVAINAPTITEIGRTDSTTNMLSAFIDCERLKTIRFTNLKTILGNGFAQVFYGCQNLETVYLPKLEDIQDSGLAFAFYGCKKLKRIDFPMLKTIHPQGFHIYTFGDCTNLTQIHFRADMAEVVPTVDGYSTVWGADNATVYFDL